MINPYEAPQTVAKPSTRVTPQLDPDLAVFQGAQYCARGGKLLMAAAISELLGSGILIWIQYAKQHGTTNLLNLCGWIFLSVSWLILLAGAVMNLRGYARFTRYLDHDVLVKLFGHCRILSWLKILLIIGLIVFYDAVKLSEFYLAQIILLPTLLISIMYSFYVHAKAMQCWSEHYPDLSSTNARLSYLWCGFGGTVLMFGLYAPFFADEKLPMLSLFSVAMLSFAFCFAAFAAFYSGLSKALKSSESAAEIV